MLRTQSLLNFSQLTGLAVTASNTSLSNSVTSPTTASVTYRVDSDGGIYKEQGVGAGFTLFETWRRGGVSSDYEVYFSYTGDAPTGGTFNTWLGCGSDRDVTSTIVINGAKATTLTVQFRSTVGHLPLDSATVTLDVDRSPP